MANNEKKCPVSHEAQAAFIQQSKDSSAQGCPVKNEMLKGCPVMHEEIDPTNNMPKNPKQVPHPEQHFPLPTDRVVSSIPKAGTEETWVYPSPQMFYNAVRRKGGDASETEMNTVVDVHNTVNEYCWRKILEWESLNGQVSPQLARFRGRYDDISPKARVLMLFGILPRPFDRHDWIVNRDGKEVRYVIDYYETGQPNKDLNNMDIELDIRPALDSVGAWWMRVKRLFN